jgi:hypothetical protein
MEMYQNALAHAGTNKELSATCLLMLGDLDSRRAMVGRSRDGNYRGSYASPYLRRLLNSYKETDIYEFSITECPDVSELMARR